MKKIYIAAVMIILLAVYGLTAYAEGKTAVMIISGEDKTLSVFTGSLAETGPVTAEAIIAGDISDGSEMVPLSDINGLEIDRVDVPDDASLLIVLGEEASSDSGTLSVYKRDTAAENGETSVSGWTFLMTAHAVSGENGLYKEAEGDKKTPVGVFKMNTPFGIGEALEGFPDNYIQVTSSHYWNGDSGSELYNKLVDADIYSGFDTSKSEHIVDYGAYYRYCIDIGYNPEGTPHLGSAIYLHCHVEGDDDTAGCVAIPEDDMIEIMRAYDEDHTYMAIYDIADMQAVYAD